MYANACSREQQIRARIWEIREEFAARREELEALMRELDGDRAQSDDQVRRRGHLRLIKGGVPASLGVPMAAEPA